MVHVTLFTMVNVLYFYIIALRSMCALPSRTVFCPFLSSCFPTMLPRYFLNSLEMVPVACIVTGVTYAFTFHMLCISVVRSLYFGIVSVSFLITFLSPEIAHPVAYVFLFHYHPLWCPVYSYGWFCRFALIGFFVNFSTDFGTWSHQCTLTNFTPVSLHAY
jgi:hypothetical protein